MSQALHRHYPAQHFSNTFADVLAEPDQFAGTPAERKRKADVYTGTKVSRKLLWGRLLGRYETNCFETEHFGMQLPRERLPVHCFWSSVSEVEEGVNGALA